MMETSTTAAASSFRESEDSQACVLTRIQDEKTQPDDDAINELEDEATSEQLLDDDDDEARILCNENALNVAFVSFLSFATVQLFFAIFYAKSQSMMTDCAAMYVDVLSYLVNFWAERLKHGPSKLSPRQLRLHRLYLELIPPFLSVITLLVVTILALQKALETLIQNDFDDQQEALSSSVGQNNNNNATENDDNDDGDDPDLNMMMAFSGFNLILDLVNVGYFVKADQAIGIGLPHQHGEERVHVEYEKQHSARQHEQCCHGNHHHDHCHHDHHHHDHHHGTEEKQATEETPLIALRGLDDTINSDHEDDDDAPESSECESEGASIGRNLNMCSAWTHVCADTLRSIAVLVAAALGAMFPKALSPTLVDSSAAIVVSIIILMSLGPLLQGLFYTACKIHAIWMGQHEHRDCQQQRQ